MKKLIIAVAAGLLLIATTPVWAGGGKNRHGQDDSQPRSRFQKGATQIPGLDSGSCVLDNVGTQLRKRDRDRDRDRDGCN